MLDKVILHTLNMWKGLGFLFHLANPNFALVFSKVD